jgi:AraC-like DNA-binding protein
MVRNNELKIPNNLKENIPHGNLLFNLAVHLTEHKIAIDIMLYSHWHEELEILYIIEGSMLLQIDLQSFIVNKGDIIIIPPNLIHGASRCNNSPCKFYATVFHPSLISSAFNDAIQQKYLDPFFIKSSKQFLYINKSSEEYDKTLHYITAIIETYYSKSFGFELLIKANILQMFYNIIQFHSIENNELKKDDILATVRIKKILAFLEDNYQSPFSLSDWALSISLSKEQFCRIFKKHFKNTPIEYLINYRISKAVDLLIQSELSIIDIAFETGFESANYFTITFKNKMHTTPKEYRNNSKKLQ